VFGLLSSIDLSGGTTEIIAAVMGTDFHHVSQWLLEKVEKLLNNRPRTGVL